MLDRILAPCYNVFVVIDKEIGMYVCGERKFKRLARAVEYMSKVHARTGVMLGIEPVVVLNKTPGYIAYLAKGMKL